jgi:hypothetical protein
MAKMSSLTSGVSKLNGHPRKRLNLATPSSLHLAKVIIALSNMIVSKDNKIIYRELTAVVSRSYDFTVPGEGLYTFTPKNFFYIVDPVSREVKFVKAESVPAVSVRITGKLVIEVSPPVQPQQATTKHSEVEIVGGTPDQHARVLNAARSAQDYIVNCNR